MIGLNIADRFQVTRLIASGSYGEVFQGVNKSTGERVAMKFEFSHRSASILQNEYIVAMALHGGEGFPHIHYFGNEKGQPQVMVMDQLGPTLEDLFQACGSKLSLKTVLMLAIQMITRIEFMHSKNLLHCDIKPSNFLMGTGRQKHQVFLIDYGLARRYRDCNSGPHIPCTRTEVFIGSHRYASNNQHRHVVHSRRDDLESIGNVLIYLLRGSLPWQPKRLVTHLEFWEQIVPFKLSLTIDRLCNGLPEPFALYFKHCRSLRFEQTPDYAFLRQLFTDLQRSFRLANDHIYDWTSVVHPLAVKPSSKEDADDEVILIN